MDDLAILGRLIDDTPGAARQLALARESWRGGWQAEAEVHCSIAADAIALTHPDMVSDPITLSRALVKLFAPRRVN